MIKEYKKIIFIFIVIIIIAGFFIFKVLQNKEIKNEKPINYKIYQDLEGLYVEYPDWMEYDLKNLEKIYPKELIEKAKAEIIIMVNDSGGSQFILKRSNYLVDTTLKDVVEILENEQKKLMPDFRILDKKIKENEVFIKSSFKMLSFEMISFNKGFLVDIPERGKRFYNVGILVIKNKLKDYQKIIDHILNISKIKNIIVFQPLENISVKSPFLVRGRVRAFDGNINLRLKDSKKKTLFEEAIAINSFDFGTMVDFEKEITFKTNDSNGILEVFRYLPNDGSELDKVSIPLKFSE